MNKKGGSHTFMCVQLQCTFITQDVSTFKHTCGKRYTHIRSVRLSKGKIFLKERIDTFLLLSLSFIHTMCVYFIFIYSTHTIIHTHTNSHTLLHREGRKSMHQLWKTVTHVFNKNNNNKIKKADSQKKKIIYVGNYYN